MNRTGVILAAHGSRLEPAVNDRIRVLAAEVHARGVANEVVAAFHQGKPGFAEAIDEMLADDIVVVPVMTSDGYYTDVVLPRELSRNRRGAHASIRCTPPVGLHRDMPSVVGARVRDSLCDQGIDAADTTLALIGHGTRRHARSRNATVRLAGMVRDLRVAREVSCAFLDDDPPIESILERATCRDVLVVPFLIGCGPHTTRDLPERLGLPETDAGTLPVGGFVGDHHVWIDAPVGTYTTLADIVAEMAGEALSLRHEVVP